MHFSVLYCNSNDNDSWDFIAQFNNNISFIETQTEKIFALKDHANTYRCFQWFRTFSLMVGTA